MLFFPRFSGSPAQGDNQNNVRGAGHRRRRPRHRFTKGELWVLNQSFEQDPYPDFTTRKQLANQIHCHLYVIEVSLILIALHGYIFSYIIQKIKELWKSFITMHYIGKSFLVIVFKMYFKVVVNAVQINLTKNLDKLRCTE